MRTPNANDAEVPPAKINGYLLSMESEEGRSKAIFFRSKGFSLAAWTELAEALKAHVRENDYALSAPTKWGVKYVVDGPLPCPDGSEANIRSVWNITPPQQHPRLITAHPLAKA